MSVIPIVAAKRRLPVRCGKWRQGAPIIICVEASQWRRGENGANLEARIDLPAGVGYATISGRRWEGAAVWLSVEGAADAPVALTRIGESVWGATEASPVTPAALRLEGDARPQALVIAAYARPYPSDRWRRVLPACLHSANPEATRQSREAGEIDATEALLDTSLSTSLAEVAADCLAGAPSDPSSRRALLRRLARHPLDRSPGLGALLGALCQKRGAL